MGQLLLVPFFLYPRTCGNQTRRLYRALEILCCWRVILATTSVRAHFDFTRRQHRSLWHPMAHRSTWELEATTEPLLRCSGRFLSRLAIMAISYAGRSTTPCAAASAGVAMVEAATN